MEKLSVALISGLIPKNIFDPYSFVFDEAIRLAKRGLDIHAIRTFTEIESSSFDIHYYGIHSSFGLSYVSFFVKHWGSFPRASFLLPPWQLLYLSKYAQTVSNVIHKNSLQIIHAHFAYPEGFVGLLAKREMRRPLVVTVHGTDILVEPSIGYGVRLNKKYDAMVRSVLEGADCIIAASNATYDEALRIATDAKKVRLIPNGVDTSRFNESLDASDLRRQLGIENQFVVFSLRAHEPKYGLEYLIRAAQIVINHRLNVVFVIAGDGFLRQYHEKLAEELGIRKNIIFTGKIASEDVPFYYALSDLVVVPSLQEAFGLVVSEAMACGKVVIGSNVGGICDQIIDGYNGFLVEPRNFEKIAEKILWAISNSEELKEMGMAGRRIVEQKFNIERRVDAIIEIYNDLIGK
jgi:glycosyltransferase involved in cell wall biosynthesis